MDSTDLLEFVRDISLFAIFDDEELESLVDHASLRSIAAGELLFDQGDEGDSFFVVYSGRVRIVRRNEDGEQINLGTKGRGEHFGETALITDEPRNAAVRATEDTVVLALDEEAFEQFFATHGELREYFDTFLQSTALHTFLKSRSELSQLSPHDLRRIVGKFESEFHEAGEVVFRQDAEPDKFYLINRGSVKVVRWENGEKEIINFLREGEFFGEKALFEETTRYADIVCVTDCQLYSLRREDFNELIEESDKLKTIVEDRIRSYSRESPPIPYEELIRQEIENQKEMTVEEVEDEEDVAVSADQQQYLRGLTNLFHQHVRFPFFYQKDERTCGTACLRMISKYYGKSFASNRLFELANVGRSGSSLANLSSAAEQLGYTTRGMKMDWDALQSATLPCIAHWQGFHYIVVYDIDEESVKVADPAKGKVRYDREEFEENWNGVTLLLEPTPDFEEQDEDRTSLWNFWEFVRPYRAILGEIFLAALLMNVFGLATPIFTQMIVDNVLVHQNVELLNLLFGGMLLVLLFRGLTHLVRQYLIVHTTMKIDLRMLVVFYKHLLALPLGYFKSRKSGDFITRFGENARIREFLTNTAMNLVLDSILVVVYITLMFYYNVQLTLVALLFIPLLIGVTLWFTPILKRLNVKSFEAQADQESHLIESINGIDTIKAKNIEHPVRWNWEDKFIKALNLDFDLSRTGMYYDVISNTIVSLSSVVILWYGAHLVLGGTLSTGGLMAFVALLGSVLTPVQRNIQVWDELQQTLVSMDRLNDILTAETEFPSHTRKRSPGVPLEDPRGKLEFEEVYFRYGGRDDPYILSDLEFTISPGETVALVGRSGSGKTTLVRLVARFYEPTEGSIYLDDVSIQNINLSSLRQSVGYVLQDNFLFNTTLRENIAYGDPDQSMERVTEAAKLAHAHDFISNLHMGYDTPVGESGIQLSGGQQQRINIARALYSDPDILIMDEATSSLDSESEQAIQNNLKKVLEDRTSIVIAHRLSTVRDADNIIVLDQGEIIEQGTHEELMAQEGLYHYLNYQQLEL